MLLRSAKWKKLIFAKIVDFHDFNKKPYNRSYFQVDALGNLEYILAWSIYLETTFFIVKGSPKVVKFTVQKIVSPITSYSFHEVTLYKSYIVGCRKNSAHFVQRGLGNCILDISQSVNTKFTSTRRKLNYLLCNLLCVIWFNALKYCAHLFTDIYTDRYILKVEFVFHFFCPNIAVSLALYRDCDTSTPIAYIFEKTKWALKA